MSCCDVVAIVMSEAWWVLCAPGCCVPSLHEPQDVVVAGLEGYVEELAHLGQL
jgi:hypothetical protein